jgi:SAM-dependent methyltransferase
VLCIAAERPGASNETTLYNPEFYNWQAAGSAASARVIVPMLTALIHPSSVLDVGCGVGGWVGTWLDSGADAIGVDGDYVPRDQLCIPADRFIDRDLSAPLELGRRFDLVTCLEVVEHLPEQAAPTIVDSLCRHADVIAFSAAVPGQGGTGHVNERWPTFWAKLFADRGYRPYDLLRSRLWWDQRCEWWYRQNLLLYATEEVAHEHGWSEPTGPLDLVHPELFVLRTSG